MEIIKSEEYYEYVYKKVISDTIIHSFFPEGIPKNVVYTIITEHQKGRRSEDIAKDLFRMFFDIPKKNIISVTQYICSIASAAETIFKSKSSGINWYVWKTSEDRRVRTSHELLHNVIVNFNDPPNPENLNGEEFMGNYNAGECSECRCYPEPIIRVDFIKWPHKVFYNGKIQVMTKEQFIAIM